MLRPVKVRQHLGFMEARGYSSREVLSRTGIEAGKLNDSTYLVSAEQCHSVVANMMRLTGDSGIGLRAGSATSIADLGIVGYAMSSSHTLGEAISLWAQYGNSPVGGPFTLKAVPPDRSGCWGATAVPTGISGSVYRFYVEETFAMGLTFIRVLTGQRPRMKQVQLSYPPPPHWRQYKALFKCPVHFDAPATIAMVAAPSLETPLRGSDDELRELCIRQCALLVRQIERRGPVGSRLRMMLRTQGRVPDLDGAAAALTMSSRSLRRHLQSEGTTFQRVLDEFRKDLADEYLRSGAMSSKEVAWLLGFSNTDSFRRAYKAWSRRSVDSRKVRRAGTALDQRARSVR